MKLSVYYLGKFHFQKNVAILLVIIFFVINIQTSFAQPPKLVFKNETFEKNGYIYHQALFTGVMIEMNDKKQTTSEISYKEGLMEGKFILYYENGKKKLESNYLKGIKNGKEIMYGNDGNILYECTFKDNIVIDGKYLPLLNTENKINSTSNVDNNSIVTDVDGNIYSTITIGTQIWMKENLKVTKYSNGDLIGSTTPATKNNNNETTPKYQWVYNRDNKNVTLLGRLYTWYVVTDDRNLCPAGWHIPSDTEWGVLIDYLGGAPLAGKKMIESGASMTQTDNSSGFTAIPGGLYNNSTFMMSGDNGFYWSSTEFKFDNTKAWHFFILFNAAMVIRAKEIVKTFGMSVRCIKD